MYSNTAWDVDGNPVYKNIERDKDGIWWVTVWYGWRPVTDVRRYGYETRAAARAGDISDEPGRRGCVRMG